MLGPPFPAQKRFSDFPVDKSPKQWYNKVN